MLRLVVFVSLAYVVARFLLVAALGDVFVYGEENEKAFVAEALRARVDVPLAKLPYHPYEGGGFLASMLKALFAPLLGVTPLLHKALAIGWGVATLAATMVLARRHALGARRSAQAGLGAALFVGLALVLAPESLTKGSLVHLGIHVEALLFIALVLHLGLAAMAVPAGERVPRGTLVALGLASGFGTWFNYQVALAVLAVIVGLALRRWRTIFAPTLMLATVLGLVPWLAMFAAVGSDVFDLHGEAVGAGGGWRGLLASVRAGFGQPLAGPALVAGSVALVAGMVFDLPQGRRLRALLVVGGFIDLWLVAAAVTGLAGGGGALDAHWFAFLRFAPVIWGLLVVLALGVGPAIEAVGEARQRPSARTARAAATIVLGIGGVALARMVDEGELGSAGANLRRLASIHATEPRNALVKILPRLVPAEPAPDAEAWIAAAAPFLAVARAAEPGPWRDELVTEIVGATAYVAYLVGVTDATAMAAGFARHVPEGVPAEAITLGLGPAFLARAAARGDLRTELARPDLDAVEAEALGLFGGWFGIRPDWQLGAELEAVGGTTGALPYFRGLGARAFRTAVLQPYWGAGAVYRPEAAREALGAAIEPFELQDDERAALFEGFDAAAGRFGFAGPLSSGG